MTVSRRVLRTVGVVALGLFCTGVFVPAAPAQVSIDEARDRGVGATVTVEGTVTRAFGAYVRFQDESGPTGASALMIRQTAGGLSDDFQQDIRDGTITQGTVLQVQGTISEFPESGGVLQINNADLDSYTVQGQGPLPDAQAVTLNTLRTNGENYESELVHVTGLDFVGAQGTFANRTSYTVADESGTATFEQGTLTFRVQTAEETALSGETIPEGTFDYTGVVGEFSNQYQLIPVRTGDVQPVRSFGFAQQFAQVEEGSGTVEVSVEAFATASGDDVSVTARVGEGSTATNGTDVTGFSSPTILDFSGGDPAPKTLSFDPAADDEEEGVERLEVVLESDDGAIARPQRFTLWIQDAPTAQGLIAEGDSGDVLIDALQQRVGDPRPLGLDFARDSLYAAVYNDAGTVEGIYSGFQVNVDPDADDPSADAFDRGLNAEHLWPQSKGAGQEPALSDLNILAPARAEVNEARSNFAYGGIPDADTDQWYFEDQSQSSPPPEADRPLWSELDSSPPDRDDRRFEPRHSVKGDVARAVFYFVTVYPNRADLQFYEAQKDTLLAWHRRDPVDAAEMRRAILQASYQDNTLNPFVMDSTLADRAYGSGGGTPSGDAISISEARSRGVGAAVTVEGTVSRAFGAFVRLQDESGPTGASGLVVRQTQGSLSGDFQQDIQDGTITQGTQLRVSGTISAFNGLFQINNEDLNDYSVQEQGPPPTPQNVSLSDLQAPDGEDYESELLRVEGLSFPNASGSFNEGTTYTVENEAGTTFEFRVQGSDETDLIGASIPEGTFTYTGVLGQFNGAGFDADAPDEGYQFIPIRPETALPVELTAFDAVRSGSSVTLTWRTASETNNARFEVQRRREQEKGRTEEGWTQIGTVAGTGTTTEPQTYRFTDASLPFRAEALTYRLKQVDLDGSATFSDPVTVQRPVDAMRLLSPFPNPARRRATVRFALPERADVTLRLYDALGRQVRTLVDGRRGGRREAQLDVSDLSSGVYFLRLQSAGHVQTERLTVVR